MASLHPLQELFRAPEQLPRLENPHRFFKIAPGDYAEGDIFLGIPVPEIRKAIKPYHHIDLEGLKSLLTSPYHDERLAALLLMVHQYKKHPERQEELYQFYLEHLPFVNNWDLVDSSAAPIVGAYLLGRDKQPLYRFAISRSLWERRIAIVSTFEFIKAGESHETFRIAEILLKDSQDLIHKAVGWMLREVGKRVSEEALLDFLAKYEEEMPSVMRRYAKERLKAPSKKPPHSKKPELS